MARINPERGLERIQGWQLPRQLEPQASFICRLTPSVYSPQGMESYRRIHGYAQCTECHLWWPRIEEPDQWVEEHAGSGYWEIFSWYGSTHCLSCGLIIASGTETDEATQI